MSQEGLSASAFSVSAKISRSLLVCERQCGGPSRREESPPGERSSSELGEDEAVSPSVGW